MDLDGFFIIWAQMCGDKTKISRYMALQCSIFTKVAKAHTSSIGFLPPYLIKFQKIWLSVWAFYSV